MVVLPSLVLEFEREADPLPPQSFFFSLAEKKKGKVGPFLARSIVYNIGKVGSEKEIPKCSLSPSPLSIEQQLSLSLGSLSRTHAIAL